MALSVLMRPSTWLRNRRTDHTWDEWLSKALDYATADEIQLDDSFVCRLKGVGIWVSNWPYAYGSFYENGDRSGLPRRSTALRLRKLVDEARRRGMLERLDALSTREPRP